MENTIFGFVLFVLYFCFTSYFFYTPSSNEAESVEPIEKQIQRMFQEIDEDTDGEVEIFNQANELLFFVAHRQGDPNNGDKTRIEPKFPPDRKNRPFVPVDILPIIKLAK
jgi:hypothetical protein